MTRLALQMYCAMVFFALDDAQMHGASVASVGFCLMVVGILLILYIRERGKEDAK